MFLTCLLNSRPPALKRNSFGILFHCFAAKYLKEFNPYFVVFTFGSDSVLLRLKSYLFLHTSSCMNSHPITTQSPSDTQWGMDESKLVVILVTDANQMKVIKLLLVFWVTR